MASVAEHCSLFPRHSHDSDDFTLCPASSPSTMGHSPADNMHMTAEAYWTYPRTCNDSFPSPLTIVGPSMYDSTYTYNRSSPGMYPDDGDMRVPSSTDSAPSAASSAVGSPLSNSGQVPGSSVAEWTNYCSNLTPSIVHNADYFFGPELSSYPLPPDEFNHHGHHEYAAATKAHPGFVDPSMIHHHSHDVPHQLLPFEGSFPTISAYPPASPSIAASPHTNPIRHGTHSPYPPVGYGYSNNNNNNPFPSPVDTMAARVGTVTGLISPVSNEPWSGDEAKEKQRCSYPECGKIFKDLKAHTLTHQTERPEKCPILTCEYHVKGFARKYDKNRHTLTHYKGNMVCGFCPGSGSAAEKSFNRADVFKRHLTALHGVEQNPPNCRRKAAANGIGGGKKLVVYHSDASGKCSTCSQTFDNAQDFYEHLDDCVLRIVQQEDPTEANNAKRLAEVENDRNVIMTLEKNKLPIATQIPTVVATDDADEDMAEDNAEEERERTDESTIHVHVSRPGGASTTSSINGAGAHDVGLAGKRKTTNNPANGVQKSRGMTASRCGVPLASKKGRKNRRDLPPSWGLDKGQMTIKKRVMTVHDGSRRLAKDDMMMPTNHELRIELPDGKSYITQLDVLTMKRAEGFHGATEEEKGPWVSDDLPKEDAEEMRRLLAAHSKIMPTTT